MFSLSQTLPKQTYKQTNKKKTDLLPILVMIIEKNVILTHVSENHVLVLFSYL